MRVALAAALSAGVVCQFLQQTDPTPPIVYFTVDSAILLLAALLVAVGRPEPVVLDEVRGAATVGVVLSGLVFATVIAPATETGTWFQPYDDYWVRAATLFLHGVGPVLAIADFLVAPQRSRVTPWLSALRWCLWPLAYLAVVLPLSVLGVLAMPYPFLDVDQVGWLAVAGAAAVLVVVVLLLGAGLNAVHSLLGKVAEEDDRNA